MSTSESQVLPSLLYTEGSKKINQEVEEELKIPDPEDAGGAIASNVLEERDGS